VSRFLEEKIPSDVPAEKVVLFFSADGTVPVEKTGDRTHTKYFFPMDGGVPVEKREIERTLISQIFQSILNIFGIFFWPKCS